MYKLLLLFALSTCVCMAQADGLAVTATRTIVLPPSEAIFSITVTGEQELTLDQALVTLKDLGVQASDLQFQNFQLVGPNNSQLRAMFGFRLTVPVARLREVNDKISQLRERAAGVELQVFLQGIFASGEAFEAARQRVFPELIREARRRAEELAASAQLKLGKVLSVFETNPYPTGTPQPVTLSPLFSVTVRIAIVE